MGHESQIELWSPNLTTFCFAGFGTDRLRREEKMKTARRESPNHGVALPRNRAHGAVGQNRSRSIMWAAKQENFQPQGMFFSLTSPFIEPRGRIAPQPGTWRGRSEQISLDQVGCEAGKFPAAGDVFFLDFSFYRTTYLKTLQTSGLQGLHTVHWPPGLHAIAVLPGRAAHKLPVKTQCAHASF